MTPDWVLPTISGAAGVAGALVGGGALLLNSRIERSAAKEAARVDALWRYYSAANRLASISHRPPVKRSIPEAISLRLEERIQTGTMLRQLFAVTDAFWDASGRVRAIATPGELDVIDRIEALIGDATFGEPAPEGWGPAMADLRRVTRQAAGASQPTAEIDAEDTAQSDSE